LKAKLGVKREAKDCASAMNGQLLVLAQKECCGHTVNSIKKIFVMTTKPIKNTLVTIMQFGEKVFQTHTLKA
jgi:hypothetical protein